MSPWQLRVAVMCGRVRRVEVLTMKYVDALRVLSSS